ncbi:MAG TPA: class I SAM-dependent methyltransferase [Thermoplasmata archaeon]|nr:class I SAM-dependent methyltransferase [Thermoplasmata archaeon]
MTGLPVLAVPRDRRCWARSLDNGLRRRWAPASVEVDLLEPLEGAGVVDLGAGTGYYVREIGRRIGPSGWIWLVDIDGENLEIARQRLPGDPRVRISVGSASQAREIPSECADRVLMSLVLCCLYEKGGALSEAWRVLRPGGRLLATFPRAFRWFGVRRRSLGMTPGLWKALLLQHPWREVPVRSGWFIERHLLEKPRTPEDARALG